jgi:hypothetical protein
MRPTSASLTAAKTLAVNNTDIFFFLAHQERASDRPRNTLMHLMFTPAHLRVCPGTVLFRRTLTYSAIILNNNTDN